MSLEPIEAIRHALGGSVNDVALAIVTGAARRYFIRKQVPVDGMDFRAMTPVSTRGDDQDSTVGNRVSAWVVDLPIGEPNPRTHWNASIARRASSRSRRCRSARRW